MDMSDQSLSTDRLTTLVTDGDREDAIAYLNQFIAAEPETRKRAMQSLREIADDNPATFNGLVPALMPFLEDEERAIRLSTAKLLVTVAEADPDAVRPVVSIIADRLTDEDEFYYVRARCAETLGYVALEYPDDVSSPDVLADLRIGLSFDEPEVKEKLAKALEYIALGDPSRIRHHVSSLVDHLDDENELVRYHVGTALVVVGCEYPEKLLEAEDVLRERLADESPYVRGRVAEAIGLLAQSATVNAISELDQIDRDETPSFLAERVRFARRQLQDGGPSVRATDEFGTAESVRNMTDDIVEEITSPDDNHECPHCGFDLPEDGPPMCPRCGAPCRVP